MARRNQLACNYVPPGAYCAKCGRRNDDHRMRHRFVPNTATLTDPWAKIEELADRCEDLEESNARLVEKIRAWAAGDEPPPIEEGDPIGMPDIRELVESIPRFTGERSGGYVSIDLDPSEAVVSRAEIVAYARHLEWQRQRIARLEARIASGGKGVGDA